VSSRRAIRLWITAAPLLAAVALAGVRPAAAQYPGQITDANKKTTELRAVGVLEWTGDLDHPKASRLVPVCVYDGQDLVDAGVYLARPAPLALESDVEYQLLQDGKPVGLFDIDSAGQQQGSWVGFGKWKALPASRPAPAQVAKIDEQDVQSDVPVLHRKHQSGDSTGSSGSDSGSGKDSNAPPPDPSRPTLHKGGDTSTTNSSGGSGQTGSGSGSGADSNSPPADPDRPTMRQTTDSSSAGASPGSDHPKANKKKEEDESYVNSVTTLSDPGRPHLSRGKSAGIGAPVLPSLIGMPPDMHQEVAVADAKTRPVHVWDYIWANSDDEAKMKAAMEDLARTALGLNPPPAAKPKTAATHRTAKPALPPPAPAPLLDEQFRVFELAYSSGATMVLSAHTGGSGAEQKFVTLVAQPDLYGGVAVLVKNVTDAAHLDDTPRMKLIDAVDARADNRGELLFELRGATQRQFALYRVLRGDATRIFLGGTQGITITISN